jgi:hypothetical protein
MLQGALPHRCVRIAEGTELVFLVLKEIGVD